MFEQIAQAFIGVGFSAAVAAAISLGIREFRGRYLAGIVAALVAFTATQVANLGARGLVGISPPDALVFLDPVVEESVRVLFIWAILRATVASDGWRSWLAFGLGYGAVESLAKLFDFLVYMHRGGAGSLDRITAIITVPVVPLLLHVFLSFVALASRKFRLPAIIALVALIVLHASHNASAVLVPPPDNFAQMFQLNLARGAGFVLLAWLIAMLLGRQSTAKTS